ncbi:pectate lyase family protein [Vibrio ziniensis]|uniref:Pectate lyase domain-containing protein n=1 Tax=Vibrio ziniensis TaxID=2711221 RepID=A0A6G7CEZ9_9VIBR|nr:hypothetical protein [Vibrio ziniensis]QIH40643.1 hypothetical protein G5S32_01035 [Vibrio ziniensis]QNR59179.1 pectate lyase [Vibrio ziniensis]
MKKTYLAVAVMATLAGCSTSNNATSSAAATSPAEAITYDANSPSIGATGWASADGPVTGGEGAKAENIYVVENRVQLVEALFGKKDANLKAEPSNERKIIYVKGTIDLTEGADGKSLTGADFIAQCPDTGFTDYDAFYDAYRKAYDPAVWNKQDLARNGRPPMVNGPLEDARSCFQKAQEAHTVLRVGSNTSILGLGTDAQIKFGTLRLGTAGREAVTNIVIRNIEFSDAFDFFPQWSPTDSFSIDKKELGQGNCSDKFVSDTVNPYGCASAGGGGRWNSEYDLIAVDNAQRVWIDHNTFSDGERTDDKFPPVWAAPYNIKEQKVQHHDGLVDITNAATKVTLSYNIFKDHDKTNLLGGSDSSNAKKGYGPGAIDVTFNHNIWDNTGQRMPRIRFGRVHSYNNYFNLNATKDKEAGKYGMMDALILGTASKLYAENNVFDIKNDGEGTFEHKIVGYYSRTNNEQKCIKTGDFDEASCGTYFYAAGNQVNGAAVDLNKTVEANQAKSSSNAKLTMLNPNDENSFWLPKKTYQYQVDSVETLKDHLLNNAGSGKIEIIKK